MPASAHVEAALAKAAKIRAAVMEGWFLGCLCLCNIDITMYSLELVWQLPVYNATA